MKKNVALRSIIFVILVLSISPNIFSEVFANWGDCSFEPGCIPGGDSDTAVYVPSGVNLMGMYIVEGAGYVLDAHAGVSTFMNRFEMAELTGADYTEMGDILNKAIDNLERARGNYFIINFFAMTTPYNQSMIEKLKAFDYDGFCEKNRLYPFVFDRVKGYLRRGDVRGVFAAILKDIDSLLNRLYTLKALTDTAKFPAIRDVWQLNQSFSEYLFFGQYFSQVIYEVK